jgi:AraC-like DNA-binding protein
VIYPSQTRGVSQQGHLAEMGRRPPFSVFTTDQHSSGDRFEAWRQSISVIFEVEPAAKNPPKGFSASVRTYNLGEILVSGTWFGAQRFKRDARKISADGLDHYLVQLYDTGSLAGSTIRRDMNVRPGDIQIVDLARPHVSTVHDSSTILAVVRRDLMTKVLPAGADLHGVVLRGGRGSGGLLADYMRSLFSRLESIDASTAPFLARATVQMIAACVQSSADAGARAPVQIEGVIAERLKRYIEQNLGSRDLSPEVLCRRFRISRTQLYRMFEPLGGVAAYIQVRRLDRAYALLRDPIYRHRRVFEIALAAGFLNITHFNGAFRRQFGLSPNETRANLQSESEDRVPTAQGYEQWVKCLRPASARA